MRQTIQATAALLLTGTLATQDLSPMPLFSFGVVADVQYADKDKVGRRHYRSSLQSLERCVTALNARPLHFTIQLGDFVDAGKASMPRVLERWNKLRMRRYHVLGNHDFPLPRAATLEKLGLKRGYYEFTVGERWRFLVLDGMDIGLFGHPKDSPRRKEATAMLAALKAKRAKNAVVWNGGIGKDQRAWLTERLRDADEKKQRVLLFCHFPIHEKAGHPSLLLWNHAQIRSLLAKHRCVAAWFNGHDHVGGYALVDGVHHVSMAGMVEAPKQNAFGIVHVFESRLELEGIGRQTSRTLRLR